MGTLRTILPLATGTLAVALPATLLPVTGWSQIAEIVVTTRKREENLQDVPLSIDAISADRIERRNIADVSDLTRELTSVQFDEGATQSDTRITVRGLSPTRGRQNVAVLVDGIDVSTEAISSSGGGILLNTRLVDVERIEVVKGPQMVLYGRSAFAGAIQYVTKDPSDVFEASFAGDVNAEEQYSAQASVSGPVFGDRLGLRLNAAWWDEQGFYDNAITGSSLGDDEGFGLALSARSQLTDTFTLRFRAEYQDQQIGPSPTAFLRFNAETPLPVEATTPATFGTTTYPAIFRCFEKLAAQTANAALDARNQRVYAPGFTPGGPAPGVLYSSPYCETAVSTFVGAPGDFDESQVAVAPDPYTNRDFEGIDRELIRLALIAEWDTGLGTLTSRTGYVHEDSRENSDNGKFGVAATAFPPATGTGFIDGGVNAFILDADKLTRQFSQELLFRSRYAGPAQISLGGLYWEEDVGTVARSLTMQASGSHCAWSSSSGFTFDDLGFAAPGTGCYGYTERPIAPLVRGGFNYGDGTPYAGIRDFHDELGYPQDRNTDHASVFGMLELALPAGFTLTAEGRYSSETVEAVGPVFLDPLASGGPGSWVPCGIFFQPCTDEFLFGPSGPFYSEANFRSPVATQPGGVGYDVWGPDYVYPATSPLAGQRFRDNIPAACLRDPAVQARLATWDDTGVDQFDLFHPYCIGSVRRDDRWFSPKLILDWQVSNDIRTYFSWSKAEKPGGFSTLAIGSSGLNRELMEFEPEELQVWELGAKTRWLDGTLVVNGAAFFQDFSEKQTLVSVLNAAGDRLVNRLENTCCAEVWGMEVDATWAPIRDFLGGNWVFRGAYTWLDAEYVGATVDNNSFTFISAVGNCTPKLIVQGVPDGGARPAGDPDDTVICNVSLDGNKLEDAPKGRFFGSISWNRPLTASLNLIAEADFQWTDKRYIEATNENWVEPDTNTDLRLGIQGDGGRWEAFAYVNNVFDDDTIYSVLGGPSLSCCFILGSGIDIMLPEGQEPTAAKTVTVELPQFRAAFAPDPRVVGLRFRYRFGADW